MSVQSPARTLLLEQLESRQLLAGGSFLHSGGHPDRDGGHQRGPQLSHMSRDVRPVDVSLQDNPRSRMEFAVNPIRMNRDGLRPPPKQMHRNALPPRSISVATIVPIQSTAPAFPDSVLGGTPVNDPPPLRVVEAQTSVRVPVPSGGSITFLVVGNLQAGQPSSASSNAAALTGTSSDASSQRAQPVSAGNATPIAQSVRAANDESMGGAITQGRVAESQYTEPQYTESQYTESQYFDPKQTQSPWTNSESEGNVVFDVPSSKSPIDSDSVFHVIPPAETSPSIEYGFRDSVTGRLAPFESSEPEDGQDASWELDRSTIERLRRLSGSVDEERHRWNDQANIDQAITDRVRVGWFTGQWFNGPGGMIEIQRVGDVLAVPDSGGSVVEIPLDAVFGTYRWLELAVSDSPTRDDTAVRDAVLAAIDGVHADQVAPLYESAAPRTDSLVYSGAALVVGTLAFTRRRKAANLMATTNRR